jgi:N-acetylglucosaminyl-diphospho-decaprenol L-rhamnosyltransferase
MQQKVKLSISIVSHYQGALVADLLSDLGAYCAIPIEVILTINAPEVLPFDAAAFGFPVTVLKNETPKGFGANHNAAFRLATAEYFCVLNPDIRLENDPFPPLLDALSDPANGVVGPLVISPDGNIEDWRARHRLRDRSGPAVSGLDRRHVHGLRIAYIPSYQWI